MQSTRHGYFDLATAMIIVGSSIVVGKIVASQFPIFMALMLRFLIALPVLFWMCHRSQTLYLPPRRVLGRVFLQALFGVFLFNVLMLAGLRFTSASQSGLLASTTPALIAILGWLLLRERISRYEWGGVGLTVAGIFIINLIGGSGSRPLDGQALLGNALVLGAFTCEALFTIFRKTSQEVPPMLGALLVTCFGFLLSLPVGMIEFIQFDLRAITPQHVLVLLYSGVFVSALAYFLWFRGLENASTSAAGILTGLLPISAVVLSTLFLSEAFTLVHLLGLLMVLSAIGIITFGSKFSPQPEG